MDRRCGGRPWLQFAVPRPHVPGHCWCLSHQCSQSGWPSPLLALFCHIGILVETFFAPYVDFVVCVCFAVSIRAA